MSEFNPITQDVRYDEDFPASMSGLVLHSGGAKLNGVIYHPAGEGPHPLVLLLHGFPGHERNLDLAQIIRRAGWHVAVFHYRGSWGSGGAYRFQHVLEDVQAALAHFRDRQIAAQQRIDPARIVLIGHSLGGWAALMTAAQGGVDAAASLAGANMGLWSRMFEEEPAAVEAARALFENELDPLSGVSAAQLVAELQEHGAAWDLTTHTAALAERRLLLVAGKRDELVLPFDHHLPLVKGLQQHDAARLEQHLIAADHLFSEARLQLARLLLDWLAEL